MNASPNIFYYYYFNLPLFVIQFVQNSLSLKFGCYTGRRRLPEALAAAAGWWGKGELKLAGYHVE
jgi:hypothetical protein